MEKLYRVTFIQYTNGSKNCVWNGKEGKGSKYLSLPQLGSLIVKETGLDKLWGFGCGFDTIEYLGELYGTIAPEFLNSKRKVKFHEVIYGYSRAKHRTQSCTISSLHTCN